MEVFYTAGYLPLFFSSDFSWFLLSFIYLIEILGSVCNKIPIVIYWVLSLLWGFVQFLENLHL